MKTRSNTAAAILSNQADLENAYVDALNAEGSALAENEKYLDSIQGRIDLLNNAIQTLWNNVLDDSVVKFFVDLGTSIVKIVDALGLIPSVLLTIGTIKIFKDIMPNFATLAKNLTLITTNLASADAATRALGVSQLKEAATIDLNSTSIMKYCIAQAAKAGADVTSLTTTELLIFGLKGLWVSITSVTKAIWTLLTTTPLGPILAVVAAIGILTTGIVHLNKATENLKEDLSNLKSEIKDIQSQLDSLNSELETTQSRMAELLSMPSLSFTEQEELEALRKQNDELEREIYLLDQRKKRKQDEAEDTFNKLMEGEFNTGSARMGVSTKITNKMALESSMNMYKSQVEAVNKAKEELVKAEESKDEKAIKEAEKNLKKAEKERDTTYKYIDGKITEYTDAAEGIDYDVADNQTKKYLDYIYNLEDRFNILSENDNQAKSIAIKRIFNKDEFDDAFENISELKKKLQENPGDQTILNQISAECKKAEDDLQAVGLSIQDAYEYFTMSSSSTDSTIDAKIAEIQSAYQKLEGFLKDADIKTKITELFDDDGNIDELKLGEIFTGIGEETQKDISSILKSNYDAIKNGTADIQDLLDDFARKGMDQVLQVQALELESQYSTVFKDIKDDVSGLIDTFSELSKALEDTASVMDVLDAAQTQMNNSGQVSIKTALELISKTENWSDVIDISNGKVTLAAGAEDALIQERVQLIQTSLENARAQAVNQLAQLNSAKASLYATNADISNSKAQATYQKATNQSTAATAAFGAVIGELASALANADTSSWRGIVSGLATLSAGSLSSAFNEAYSAAMTTLETQDNANALSEDELEKQIQDIDAMLAMVDKVDSPSEFKNNYDFSKTPGDKYTDAAKDALDNLQKKYDRQIASLDHQKESLQNEIDLLEAQDEGVSKQYYEKQIELEQQKLDLYAQEREELVALLSQTAKGSNEWYEIRSAIYEVENATQEATLAMVEMRNAIKDLYKEAFDKIDQAHSDLDDLYSDRESYIEKYAELMDLEDEPKTAGMYIALMNQESQKLANSMAEVADLQYALNQYLANGGKKGDENWVAMESSIRDAEAAILDSKVALAQYKEELKQLKVEAFELVRNAFSNKNNYYSAQQDYINEYISYLEAQGIDAPEEIYEKLIEIEQEKRANAIENLADARQGLAKIEAAGYTAADEEWVDANNTVVELEKSILECDTAIAEWNKTIQEMDFSKFDEFADKVDSFNNELDNVYKLVSDEDVAFEDGTWTKEGLTSLAMLYQQIENNKKMIAEYNEELEKLNNLYQSGEISEKDYLERAEELKDNQWSLIHTNEDLKDSIIDINEARIDLIEEGISKEIDAYQELIDLKKKELDAERDLYDFKRNVEKQTKNIAELERKIAALSGSSSASDKAELRKLQAQLKDAQDELNDTYYNQAKDSQSKALDDEMEAYREAREDYVEQLREKLKNVDTIINETLSNVLLNANVVFDELKSTSEEYDVTLSDNLMNPWQQMSAIATETKNQIGVELLSLNEDNIASFSEYAGTLLVAPFEQGGSAVDAFKTSTIAQVDEIQTKVYEASSNLTRDLAFPWESTYLGTGSPINTFSSKTESALSKAVSQAQTKAEDMENSLTSPWEDGQTAVHTWSDDVKNTLETTVTDVNNKLAKINTEINNTKSNLDSLGSSGGGKETTTTPTTTTTTTTNPTKTAHKWAGSATGYLKLDSGETCFKHYQTGRQYSDENSAINAAKSQVIAQIKEAFITDVVLREGKSRSVSEQLWKRKSQNIKWNSASAFYAKGTLGTKKDELAITDEPQFGDELVLVPTKSGNLSFMRKGTGVVPAKLTEEIMDIANVGLDGLMNSNQTSANINMVSNAISKPELNFNVEKFLSIDKVDEGSLPEVKKFVQQELDNFVRKLNYSLKSKGAT